MSKRKKPVVVSYAWKKAGGAFTGIDPRAAAESLEEIRSRHGELKPGHVVEAAREPSHPLHPAFPWDDAEAARIGREMIAGQLIRSIRVVVETPERKQVDTRAYASSPDEGASGGRSDRPVLDVLEGAEDDLHAARVARAEGVSGTAP